MELGAPPTRFKKFPLAIRIISMVLIVSFLAYDISWACPNDSCSLSIRRANPHTLQIQLKSTKNDFQLTFEAKYLADRAGQIARFIESHPHENLSDIALWEKASDRMFDHTSFSIDRGLAGPRDVRISLFMPGDHKKDNMVVLRYSLKESDLVPDGLVSASYFGFDRDLKNIRRQVFLTSDFHNKLISNIKALSSPATNSDVSGKAVSKGTSYLAKLWQKVKAAWHKINTVLSSAHEAAVFICSVCLSGCSGGSGAGLNFAGMVAGAAIGLAIGAGIYAIKLYRSKTAVNINLKGARKRAKAEAEAREQAGNTRREFLKISAAGTFIGALVGYLVPSGAKGPGQTLIKDWTAEEVRNAILDKIEALDDFSAEIQNIVIPDSMHLTREDIAQGVRNFKDIVRSARVKFYDENDHTVNFSINLTTDVPEIGVRKGVIDIILGDEGDWTLFHESIHCIPFLIQKTRSLPALTDGISKYITKSPGGLSISPSSLRDKEFQRLAGEIVRIRWREELWSYYLEYAASNYKAKKQGMTLEAYWRKAALELSARAKEARHAGTPDGERYRKLMEYEAAAVEREAKWAAYYQEGVISRELKLGILRANIIGTASSGSMDQFIKFFIHALACATFEKDFSFRKYNSGSDDYKKRFDDWLIASILESPDGDVGNLTENVLPGAAIALAMAGTEATGARKQAKKAAEEQKRIETTRRQLLKLSAGVTAVGVLVGYHIASKRGSKEPEPDKVTPAPSRPSDDVRAKLIEVLKRSNYFKSEIEGLSLPEQFRISRGDMTEAIRRFSDFLNVCNIEFIDSTPKAGAYMMPMLSILDTPEEKRLTIDINAYKDIINGNDLLIFHEAIHLNPVHKSDESRKLELRRMIEASSTISRSNGRKTIAFPRKDKRVLGLYRELLRVTWQDEIEAHYIEIAANAYRAQSAGKGLEQYLKDLADKHPSPKFIFETSLNLARAFTPGSISPKLQDLVFSGLFSSTVIGHERDVLFILAQEEFDPSFDFDKTAGYSEEAVEYRKRFYGWARQNILGSADQLSSAHDISTADMASTFTIIPVWVSAAFYRISYYLRSHHKAKDPRDAAEFIISKLSSNGLKFAPKHRKAVKFTIGLKLDGTADIYTGTFSDSHSSIDVKNTRGTILENTDGTTNIFFQVPVEQLKLLQDADSGRDDRVPTYERANTEELYKIAAYLLEGFRATTHYGSDFDPQVSIGPVGYMPGLKERLDDSKAKLSSIAGLNLTYDAVPNPLYSEENGLGLFEMYFNSGRGHIAFRPDGSRDISEEGPTFTETEQLIIAKVVMSVGMRDIQDRTGIQLEDLLARIDEWRPEDAAANLSEAEAITAELSRRVGYKIKFGNKLSGIEFVLSKEAMAGLPALQGYHWQAGVERGLNEIKGSFKNQDFHITIGPEYCSVNLYDKKTTVEKMFRSVKSGVVLGLGDSSVDISFLSLKPEGVDYRPYYLGRPEDIDASSGINAFSGEHVNAYLAYDILREAVERHERGEEALSAIIADVDNTLTLVDMPLEPRMADLLAKAMSLGISIHLITGGIPKYGHYLERIVDPLENAFISRDTDVAAVLAAPIDINVSSRYAAVRNAVLSLLDTSLVRLIMKTIRRSWKFDPAAVKDILIVAIAGLGDAVMQTAEIDLLKKRFPDARITVLARPELADVFRYNPLVHEIVLYPKPETKMLNAQEVKIISVLRSRGFDLCILDVLSNSIKPKLIALAAGVKYIVADGSLYPHSGFMADRVFYSDPSLHRIDGLLSAALSVEAQAHIADDYMPRQSLYIPDAEKEYADNLFRGYGISPSDIVIGIHIGSAGNINTMKRWPKARFAELAARIKGSFPEAKIIVYKGPYERDEDLAVFEDIGCHVYVGDPGVLRTAAVIERNNLFIANDSGLGHMAAALGVPVVSIFGPTDPSRYAPYGKNVRVVRPEKPCPFCSVMHRPERCEGRIDCLNAVSVDKVLSVVAEETGRPRSALEGPEIPLAHDQGVGAGKKNHFGDLTRRGFLGITLAALLDACSGPVSTKEPTQDVHRPLVTFDDGLPQDADTLYHVIVDEYESEDRRRSAIYKLFDIITSEDGKGIEGMGSLGVVRKVIEADISEWVKDTVLFQLSEQAVHEAGNRAKLLFVELIPFFEQVLYDADVKGLLYKMSLVNAVIYGYQCKYANDPGAAFQKSDEAVNLFIKKLFTKVRDDNYSIMVRGEILATVKIFFVYFKRIDRGDSADSITEKTQSKIDPEIAQHSSSDLQLDAAMADDYTESLIALIAEYLGYLRTGKAPSAWLGRDLQAQAMEEADKMFIRSVDILWILTEKIGADRMLTQDRAANIFEELAVLLGREWDEKIDGFGYPVKISLATVLRHLFFRAPDEFRINFIAAQSGYPVERIKKAKKAAPKLWDDIEHAVAWRLRDIVSKRVDFGGMITVLMLPEFQTKTKDLAVGLGTTWSMALACTQTLKQIGVSYRSSKGYDKKMLSATLDILTDSLRVKLPQLLYGPDTGRCIISIHEGNTDDETEIFKRNAENYKAVALKNGVAEDRIITINGSEKGAKENLLKQISQSRDVTAVTLVHHGSPQYLDFKRVEDREVTGRIEFPVMMSFEELSSALLERARAGGASSSLKDVTIFLDACYGFDYTQNLIGHLGKSLQAERLALDMPTILTSANSDREGYGNVFDVELVKAAGPVTIGTVFFLQDKESVFYKNDPAFFMPLSAEAHAKLISISGTPQIPVAVTASIFASGGSTPEDPDAGPELVDFELDLPSATGWDASDRVEHVILVSDNTGTLTKVTYEPIAGDMLDGLMGFLSDDGNRMLVNTGDSYVDTLQSQRLLLQRLAHGNINDRYQLIAGSGKVMTEYGPDGSIASEEIAEDWPIETRMRYGKAILDTFFTVLLTETESLQGAFSAALQGVTPDDVRSAHQGAIERFNAVCSGGLWGMEKDGSPSKKFIFKLLSGDLAKRLADPYIYDIGSALCLEIQDMKKAFDKTVPGQKDTLHFATRGEADIMRALPDESGLYILSGGTFLYLSKSTKAIAVEHKLEGILSSIPPDEKVLIIQQGDGRNDIPTFRIDYSRYPNVRALNFYLNHIEDDAGLLPATTYVTQDELVEGGLSVVQWCNTIRGSAIGDAPPFQVKKWVFDNSEPEGVEHISGGTSASDAGGDSTWTFEPRTAQAPRNLSALDRNKKWNILLVGPFVNMLGEDTVLLPAFARRLHATFPNATINVFSDYPDILDMDQSLKGYVRIINPASLDNVSISRRSLTGKSDLKRKALEEVLSGQKPDIVVDLLRKFSERDDHITQYYASRRAGRRPYIVSTTGGLEMPIIMNTELYVYDHDGNRHFAGLVLSDNVYDIVEEACDFLGMDRDENHSMELSREELQSAGEAVRRKLLRKGTVYDPSKPLVFINIWAISSFAASSGFSEHWRELLTRLSQEDVYIVVSLGGEEDYLRLKSEHSSQHSERVDMLEMLQEICDSSKNMISMDLVGREVRRERESIQNLIRMMAVSDLVITPDSGPMHVGNLLGKHVVVVGYKNKTGWYTNGIRKDLDNRVVDIREPVDIGVLVNGLVGLAFEKKSAAAFQEVKTKHGPRSRRGIPGDSGFGMIEIWMLVSGLMLGYLLHPAFGLGFAMLACCSASAQDGIIEGSGSDNDTDGDEESLPGNEVRDDSTPSQGRDSDSPGALTPVAAESSVTVWNQMGLDMEAAFRFSGIAQKIEECLGVHLTIFIDGRSIDPRNEIETMNAGIGCGADIRLSLEGACPDEVCPKIFDQLNRFLENCSSGRAFDCVQNIKVIAADMMLSASLPLRNDKEDDAGSSEADGIGSAFQESAAEPLSAAAEIQHVQAGPAVLETDDQTDEMESFLSLMHQSVQKQLAAWTSGGEPRKILIAEELFNPTDVEISLRSVLNDAHIEILPAKDIRAIVTREDEDHAKKNLACILGRNEFNSFWKESHLINGDAKIIVLDDDFKEDHYFFLEAIIGFTYATMNQDEARIRIYAEILFEETDPDVVISEKIVSILMKPDSIGLTNVELKFKTVPFDPKKLEHYKWMMEEYLRSA